MFVAMRSGLREQTGLACRDSRGPYFRSLSRVWALGRFEVGVGDAVIRELGHVLV